MNRLSRRLLGLAPLIVGLGLLSLWVLHRTHDGDRARAETAIQVRWETPAAVDDVTRDVDAYLTRYGDDPAAAWFAAEAYGHLRDVHRGVLAVTTRPEARDQAGAAGRLARLLIRPLAVARGSPDVKAMPWIRVLFALLDADDADATREWREWVATATANDVMPAFIPSQRTPSRASRIVAESLFRRTEPIEARMAGAALLAGPGRTDVVPTLLEAFDSPWRTERRPFWHHVTRALGTTGDPRALAALRAEKPSETFDPRMSNRRAVLVGLALGGDTDAKETLLGEPAAERDWFLGLYGFGLSVRLAQDDETAIPRLLELWDRVPEAGLRFQLARAVLLADPAPMARFPADRWVEVLAESAEPAHRVIALIHRYRAGRAAWYAELAPALLAAAAAVDLANPPLLEHADLGIALEVLRAWLRFGN